MVNVRAKIAITGLVLVFGLISLYSKVKAQEAPIGPPPQGSYVTIQQPMISCDLREQIEQIATAKLQSDEAAQAKFNELHAIQNKDNEASCMFGRLQMAVAVGESIALPDLKFGDTEVKAYAIHVGTSRGDWWSLYIVPKTENKGTSI